MKASQLKAIGVPKGACMEAAFKGLKKAVRQGLAGQALESALRAVSEGPERFQADSLWGDLAVRLIDVREAQARYAGRSEPAPWKQWGDNLDEAAVRQMRNACLLPVSVAGALMPDAHVGYGLPIGGVLAVDNAVIPYAVGVDIACRMKLSVLDIPVSDLAGKSEELAQAIERETRFGMGAKFTPPQEHAVMRDPAWDEIPVLRAYRGKAANQLGTSGGGNHFVEFGVLDIMADGLGLEPGAYVALLSHSGSRGTGEAVAKHYSGLAMELHPELPEDLRHLAWLDLDADEGREYWRAMELMGRYSAANHELIHGRVAQSLGADVLAGVENHHNFAWKESWGGREVVVHRKGATPAAQGVLGVIPGSMAASGYVVRGKGNPASLNSAAHGAGRAVSRVEAKRRFKWDQTRELLRERNVSLISGGLDESPMAYKDIESVMAFQADLVERMARFSPRIVKMAPPGKEPSWRRKKKKMRQP